MDSGITKPIMNVKALLEMNRILFFLSLDIFTILAQMSIKETS